MPKKKAKKKSTKKEMTEKIWSLKDVQDLNKEQFAQRVREVEEMSGQEVAGFAEKFIANMDDLYKWLKDDERDRKRLKKEPKTGSKRYIENLWKCHHSIPMAEKGQCDPIIENGILLAVALARFNDESQEDPFSARLYNRTSNYLFNLKEVADVRDLEVRWPSIKKELERQIRRLRGKNTNKSVKVEPNPEEWTELQSRILEELPGNYMYLRELQRRLDDIGIKRSKKAIWNALKILMDAGKVKNKQGRGYYVIGAAPKPATNPDQ